MYSFGRGKSPHHHNAAGQGPVIPPECDVPRSVSVPRYKHIVERHPVIYETIRTECEYINVPVEVTVEERNLPADKVQGCCDNNNYYY